MQTAIEFTLAELPNGVYRLNEAEHVGRDPAVPADAIEVDLSYPPFQIALEDACRLAGVELYSLDSWKAYAWSRGGASAHVIAVRCNRSIHADPSEGPSLAPQ